PSAPPARYDSLPLGRVTAGQAMGQLQIRREPRGPWGLWLRLTTPPSLSVTVLLNAADRERQRRARLLSVFLLAAFVVDLALVPETLRLPSLVFGVFGALPVILFCCVLNRVGWVTTASTLFVTGVALAVAANQLLTLEGLSMRSR